MSNSRILVLVYCLELLTWSINSFKCTSLFKYFFSTFSLNSFRYYLLHFYAKTLSNLATQILICSLCFSLSWISLWIFSIFGKNTSLRILIFSISENASNLSWRHLNPSIVYFVFNSSLHSIICFLLSSSTSVFMLIC